jgi:hypothetical protein
MASSNGTLSDICWDAAKLVGIFGSAVLMENLAQQNQPVELSRARLEFRTSVAILGNFFSHIVTCLTRTIRLKKN